MSSIWGAGKKPNTYLTNDVLRLAFLRRRGGRRHADQVGKFVIVAPLDRTPLQVPFARF